MVLFELFVISSIAWIAGYILAFFAADSVFIILGSLIIAQGITKSGAVHIPEEPREIPSGKF